MRKKKTVLTRLPKAQQGMPVPAPGSRPEEQAMAAEQQGMPPQEAQMQQQGPPPQAMDEQMQALLQEVASMLEKGADPMTIIGGLLESGLAPEMVMQVVLQTGMAQDEQIASQMIQETMAQMQQGGGQQQPPAEGQPAPEQMQGQPMMALGGETALNDNIIEFAQLTGQNEKDVEDMVTTMIQQGTDAQTVSDKLEEAIIQIQQQQAQPQGMGQGIEQTAAGESQIQPPIIDGQTPAMRYGGPTPVDFQEISQQIIKRYRKGGASMGELDTSNTKAYVQNLKGAISNWVSTNNNIGLIKKRTEKNLELFDELPESVAMLPSAKKGIEIDKITDEADKKYYTELKDKFKDYETADWDELNQAYNEGKITAGEFDGLTNLYGIVKPQSENKNTETKTETKTETNTNSNIPNQGESYDSFAIRTGKQSQPGSYTNMVWNGTQWVNTGANSNNPQYYYPGQYSDYGRSMSGQSYRPTNRFMSSVTDMAQQLGRRNVNPFIQGVGSLAGSSEADVMKRLREVLNDPNYKGQIAFEDIHKKGMFGREKKKVIGTRILWNPNTGKTETVTTDNATDPKATTTQNAGYTEPQEDSTFGIGQGESKRFVTEAQANDYLKAQNLNPNLTVDEFLKSQGTQSNTAKDANLNALDAQMQKLLTSTDKKERQAALEYFKDRNAGNTPTNTPANTPANTATNTNNAEQANTAKSEAAALNTPTADEKYANRFTDQALTNLGYTQEQFDRNSKIRDKVYAEEEKLFAADKGDPEDNFRFNVLEELGITPDEYDADENVRSTVIQKQNEIQDYLNKNGLTIDQYNQDPSILNASGSTGFDPEKGFYAQGGELDEKIIWDFKNKKYSQAPTLVAKNGLATPKIFSNPFNLFAEKSNQNNAGETYSQSQDYEEGAEMVQQKSGLDWDNIANSIYGAGSYLNEKKRLLNSATSKYEAADARAGMFNPITPRSGEEGLYTQFGDFIPDRTGAKVLPGTGSDQSVNTEGAANNIFEDINPGGVNLFSRNGGILKFAENGIEIDQEYDLTEDDLDELMPYLQQLGLTIQMI